MIKLKKITIFTILTTILLICSLSAISAANQTINSTSTGGIAQGITDTGTGETLFLQPGTYNKNNQDTNIVISKNVTIQGNGSTDSVIIDAQRISRIFTIASNTNATFINITFINGNATVEGGGILCGYNGIMTVINCTFINNTGFSGAISSHSNLTIIDSSFTNNSALINGGAVNAGDSPDFLCVVIINCNFTNNSARVNSGAVHIDPSEGALIKGCTFINNTAIDYGGGMAVGAATIQSHNLTVENCTFINNSAKFGGGFFSSTINVTVSSCNFINNIAENDGGAIFAHSKGSMFVTDSTFIENIAYMNGGGIYNDANITVSGNTMSDNVANGLGNAIYNNRNMGILNLTYLSNSTVTSSKGSTENIYATLTDDMGNAVTGQVISFYVDGVFIANVTSIEGEVNTTYTVTKTGVVLPVTGDYVGHGGYSIVLKNGALLIPKILTNIIVCVPEEVKVGETVTIESNLTDEDGNPIANATVDFYVDGKKIGSAVTDKNGIARLNHTFNKADKTVVEAKYAGNDTYIASNATNKTTVSKISTIITVETDDDTITATLTDENGNPLANKKITITVNGKTFTRTTDSNGQVIINYPNANKYKVTAKFADDDKYLSSNATAPAESEPNEPTQNIQASGKITMKSSGIPIIAILLTIIASIGLILRKKD